MKNIQMTEGKPLKVLLAFAIPMIFGNLFQQLYNMADTVIVGKFVGEDALAAVGASYALTNVFIMFAIGGGIGASVIIAQYLGAKQYRKMKISISTALITFFIVSIVLAVFGVVMNRLILTALKTPSNILNDAMRYLAIYFVGLPFLFMYNIFASIFQAMGDSKTPLYLLIFSSVLNVILDLVSVLNFHMGVSGVAIATVIAQGLACLISGIILFQRIKTYQSEPMKRWYDTEMLKSMVRVAIPSIIQQSIVSIGMLLVQSVVNSFGSPVLAGYTAGMRIESICIIPMIALGNAMSTFTAQNMGANKKERIREGYKASYGIAVVFALLLCVILTVFHKPIVAMFLEPDSGVGASFAGEGYLSFIAFFFIFIGLKAITDGVLRGAGDVLVFTIANLINLSIRVIVAFQFAPIWGVQAVWIAIPIGWTTNYVISLIRYLSGKWAATKLI